MIAYLIIAIMMICIVLCVLAIGYQAAKVWNDDEIDFELAYLLRHFAERVPVCWEGNDADYVAAAMLRAADLLDGDR